MSQPAHITKLITLLNVANARPATLKRERDEKHQWHSIAKKARLADLLVLPSKVAEAPAVVKKAVVVEETEAPGQSYYRLYDVHQELKNLDQRENWMMLTRHTSGLKQAYCLRLLWLLFRRMFGLPLRSK